MKTIPQLLLCILLQSTFLLLVAMSSNIYPFILFNITFPAFSLILSFSLPLLGLGLHGDALQCVADLGHPADAATGHALVPTPPASDFKKHTSSPPTLLCCVLPIISVTNQMWKKCTLSWSTVSTWVMTTQTQTSWLYPWVSNLSLGFMLTF